MRLQISIQSLFLFLLLTLFLSCNKDDPSGTSEKTIGFTVEDDYADLWVMISDDAGKVIDWKAIPNLASQEFKYQLKEKVTVTVIRKAGNSTRLRTYTHVEAGDYHIGFGLEPQSVTTQGNFNVAIPEPDDYPYIYPEAEGNCDPLYFPDVFTSQIEVPLCESSSNLYFAINDPSDNLPCYYYDTEIHSNESLTINDEFVSALPKLTRKVIVFDQAVEGSSKVFGITKDKKKTFEASFTGTNNGSTKQFPIYYPADLTGQLFTDYIFRLYYYSEAKVKYMNYKEGIEPPSEFPALDANLNLADTTTITTEKISFPVTGLADFVFIVFNYRDKATNQTGWWYVYSEFTSPVSVNLPVLPDDLKATVDLSFVSKLKKTQISFIEDKGNSGYKGYYQKFELRANETQSDDIFLDQRQKMYILNNRLIELSIGGRKSEGK
jgi:hypothetical protein